MQNCSKLLDAGITTARDLGSKGLLGVKIRDLINSGSISGPRLQVEQNSSYIFDCLFRFQKGNVLGFSERA
jgi:hypothetical protein